MEFVVVVFECTYFSRFGVLLIQQYICVCFIYIFYAYHINYFYNYEPTGYNIIVNRFMDRLM